MKAVVCTTLGEPNLLEIQDNPIPEPQKNEVLIKVAVSYTHLTLPTSV